MQSFHGETLTKTPRGPKSKIAILDVMPRFCRWNGVVGHTLYGDVDVGMCNIDITHVRYSAIEYSAYTK